MVKRLCDNCEAFMKLTNECRMHAPKANMVSISGQPTIMTIFPITKPESWCLEFIPHEENNGSS